MAADYDATVGGGVDAAAIGGVEFHGAYGVVDFRLEVDGYVFDTAVASLCHDGEILDFPCGGLGGGGGIAEREANFLACELVEVYFTRFYECP